MSEIRSVGALRSTLIGIGVLAFTFFPPTSVELLGDGVTVALFAIATLGGIMQLGAEV